ncbi:MAG: hypothetical protein IPP97_09790 [Candidatus Obscuribacter sp.]|jgi:hypothetical protein|nr:hypothetical protein [Candidatus Obscuribacter sp.]MBP6350729.1 hypothetical protein [Candidatus Obscuribacter sp.]
MKKPSVVVLIRASLVLVLLYTAIHLVSIKRGIVFVRPDSFVNGNANTLRGVDDVRKFKKDLMIPLEERNIDGAMVKHSKP